MKNKFFVGFDPRALLFVVACSSVLAVGTKSLLVAAANTATMFVFAVLCGSDVKGLFQKLKRLWQVILFATLMQSVFLPSGMVLLQLFEWPILTIGGLLRGGIILLRLANLMCGAALLLTCGQRRLIAGLTTLKLPYEFSYMVLIGLRFLPVLQEEMQDALVSIQLRGVDLNKIPLGKKVSAYSYLLFPVIAGNLIRAQDLAISMDFRGFRAHTKQTDLVKLRLQPSDAVLMAFFWRLAGRLVCLEQCRTFLAFVCC